MGLKKKKPCACEQAKYGKKVEGATDESLYFFWQPHLEEDSTPRKM